MNEDRISPGACSIQDKFVYVFGGYEMDMISDSKRMMSSIEKYNIELNFWTVLDDIKLPNKISNAISCPVNNQYIVIFGGAILANPPEDMTESERKSYVTPEPVVNQNIFLLHLKHHLLQQERSFNEQFKVPHSWVKQEHSEPELRKLPLHSKICGHSQDGKGLI